MNEDYYNQQNVNNDYNSRQTMSYQQQGQPPQPQSPQGQPMYVQPPQGQPLYARPPQGQPMYGQYTYYTPPQYGLNNPVPGNGLATASLVCGILSLVIPFVNIILGIIAIATGASAKKNGFAGGKATAGIAMGIISTALNAGFICLSVLGLIAFI